MRALGVPINCQGSDLRVFEDLVAKRPNFRKLRAGVKRHGEKGEKQRTEYTEKRPSL